MKRHESLIPLSSEHQSHLVFANRLKKGKPSKIKSNWPTLHDKTNLILITKEYFTVDMLNHFDLEEKYVFPVYELHNSDKEYSDLLQKILDEHKSVKDRIHKLDEIEEKDLEKELFEIGTHIEQHIRVEERRLFEDIQNKIPLDELIEIGIILKEKSRLVCSNLL